MLGRKAFTWKVRLQKSTGTVVNKVIRNYWSPAHEGTREAIGLTALAMEMAKSKQQLAVISVERADD